MERVAALRLPAIYFFPEFAEEGGFAGYGPRNSQLWTEVMTEQMVKLFRGADALSLIGKIASMSSARCKAT
jgi:putative tryptophan/tyrosine transport system substrate-binding protein